MYFYTFRVSTFLNYNAGKLSSSLIVLRFKVIYIVMLHFDNEDYSSVKIVLENLPNNFQHCGNCNFANIYLRIVS